MTNQYRQFLAFIIPSLQYGGAERVLSEIINNLNRNKFDCCIISFVKKADNSFAFKNDIKQYYLCSQDQFTSSHKLPVNSVAKIKIIYRLSRLIAGLPRNTILVPFLARPTAAYTTIAQIFSPRRIFASMHTIESEYMKFNYQSDVQRRLEEFLLKIACRGSDKIIAASKGVKSDLINNFSVPATKIKVIDNPVDLAKIYRMKAHTPIFKFADLSTKTIFVHIGRLSVEKNHRLLIQAAAILKDLALNFLILIAGAGDQEMNIRGWIQDANLQDRVIMLGSVNNPYALMNRARALLLTSHYDSSPMVLKEAMASGTAVISVDCPHGPADILKSGKYGMIVAPNDPNALANAMLSIANDDRLFVDLVQKGQKYVGRYDIGSIVDQWQELLLWVG